MAAARGKGILALLGEPEEDEEPKKKRPRDPLAEDGEEMPDEDEEGDDEEAEAAGLELADALESRDGKRIAEAFARLQMVT